MLPPQSTDSSRTTLQNIYHLKRELSNLRHLIWLQRDTLASLLRDKDSFTTRDLEIYVRDCYGHLD